MASRSVSGLRLLHRGNPEAMKRDAPKATASIVLERSYWSRRKRVRAKPPGGLLGGQCSMPATT
eukprot:9497237-Pyramimonas_sp.AAC.1